MDTRTGEIVPPKQAASMSAEERQYLVPFNRPLTVREVRRGIVGKYSPCACGSGKKFKFCCYKPH